MNIRALTHIIIRKDSEFLMGAIMGGPDLRWTTSPWEAWGTRDRKTAEQVADKVGGELWLFNPVAGQLQEMKRQAERPPVPAEVEGDGRTTWWFVCGGCHGAINPYDEKCDWCGRRVSW